MKNILATVYLLASLCFALDLHESSFLATPRFNETCDSMENAKLCEENCQQLYQLCLEKYSDEINCERGFFICIDCKLQLFCLIFFSILLRPKTADFFSLRCLTTDNIFFFFVFLRLPN